MTALLVVLVLCWPTATALAAAATPVPVQHSCCMRMSHACHPEQQSGVSVQAICRTCGWCHALPNASAGQISPKVSFHTSMAHAAPQCESESHPSIAASSLQSSRAPPRSFALAWQA